MSAKRGRMFMSGMSGRRATLLALLAIGFVAPRSLQAQFEGFLSSIHDVRIQQTCWEPRDGRSGDRCSFGSGYGLEVIWRVLESASVDRYLRPKSTTVQTRAALLKALDATGSGGCAGVCDTVRLTIIERAPGAVPESVAVLRARSAGTAQVARALDSVTVTFVDQGGVRQRVRTTYFSERENDDVWSVIADMGLGYGQYAGVTSSDPAFSLRGVTREIPALSMRFSLWRPKMLLSPYVTAKTGFIELVHTQATELPEPDDVPVFSGTSRSVQLAWAVGVHVRLLSDYAYLFVETGRAQREFSSIDWKAGSSTTIPRTFPRTLDLSGRSLSFGLHVVFDR